MLISKDLHDTSLAGVLKRRRDFRCGDALALFPPRARNRNRWESRTRSDPALQKRATFPSPALGLPRGNRFRILCTPMTSSRPAASARPRRMLIAFAGLVIACGTAKIAGDESPPREEGARVEINGSRHKEARVEVRTDRRKAKRAEIVSDSKDTVVQVNSKRRKANRIHVVSDSKDTLVEINRGH